MCKRRKKSLFLIQNKTFKAKKQERDELSRRLLKLLEQFDAVAQSKSVKEAWRCKGKKRTREENMGILTQCDYKRWSLCAIFLETWMRSKHSKREEKLLHLSPEARNQKKSKKEKNSQVSIFPFHPKQKSLRWKIFQHSNPVQGRRSLLISSRKSFYWFFSPSIFCTIKHFSVSSFRNETKKTRSDDFVDNDDGFNIIRTSCYSQAPYVHLKVLFFNERKEKKSWTVRQRIERWRKKNQNSRSIKKQNRQEFFRFCGRIMKKKKKSFFLFFK